MTVFQHISKHLKVRQKTQKCSAASRFFQLSSRCMKMRDDVIRHRLKWSGWELADERDFSYGLHGYCMHVLKETIRAHTAIKSEIFLFLFYRRNRLILKTLKYSKTDLQLTKATFILHKMREVHFLQELSSQCQTRRWPPNV